MSRWSSYSSWPFFRLIHLIWVRESGQLFVYLWTEQLCWAITMRSRRERRPDLTRGGLRPGQGMALPYYTVWQELEIFSYYHFVSINTPVTCSLVRSPPLSTPSIWKIKVHIKIQVCNWAAELCQLTNDSGCNPRAKQDCVLFQELWFHN